MRFEVVHNDPLCRKVLADACVHLVAGEPSIRFVAPESSVGGSYVSYWHSEPGASGGKPV